MLSRESLIEQAKTNGMPQNKTRGIMREYIQTIMLKILYSSNWSDKFYFLGGTCLRLTFGFKRFSEDLDFNVKDMERREFEKASEFVLQELKKESIEAVVEFKHRKRLFCAAFTFRNVLEYYKIFDRRGTLTIKFETNNPLFKLYTESSTISSFGEIFTVNTMSKGAIFAEKIDALRHIKKGRHIYDIIMMLAKKFPIEKNVLKAIGIKEEPKEAILNIVNEFKPDELKRLAKGFAPFLFDEKEASLVESAPAVIKDLLEKYYTA